MMMVRSSEHTTLQHTTLTSWGTSRGLCAHYGCRPAISRPMAPPNCPTACWRWGVQLGQGGGGAIPLRLRVGGKGASAPTLCEGVEPVCENWNRPNRFLQKLELEKPESFQVGRVGRHAPSPAYQRKSGKSKETGFRLFML